MTENLLDGNVADNLPPIDPNRDYLEELIGEGGKFYDPDRNAALKKLARGKVESDRTIRERERQNDELRNDFLQAKKDATARANLEQLIDQLKNQQVTSNNQPPVNEPVEEKPPIDLTQIEKLVSNKLQEAELSKRQEQNVNLVKSKLIERYGEDYKSALKQQVDQLGLTPEFINDLTRNYPTVLFKTLGLDREPVRESFETPPKSSSNFAPSTGPKRTWSYYERIRKEQPEVYHDPQTQNQLIRDAATLGDEFKDGNYRSL